MKDILERYGINEYIPYGYECGKINPTNDFGKAKVILVSATTPNKSGIGKTTVSIGLNDELNKLGYKSVAVLREPSIGPVFGLKGGATGGGDATILPEDEINLHFTGDMHAITLANNLIASMIDNVIYHDNKLDIQEVTFNRTIDLNDRALRHITLSSGRKDNFDITAASELMSVFCMANSFDDLKNRLNDIIIGYNSNLMPVHVISLGITDALLAILKNAFKPNVVRSKHDNLVIVHGGPFANISHGCSSLISLKTATNIADYVVTEAGFSTEIGGYKFIDILTRENKIDVCATVLVTTIASLKENGNGSLDKGIENLDNHIENLQKINDNVVVCLNNFPNDDINDIKFITNYVKDMGISFVTANPYKDTDTLYDLATIITSFENKNQLRYLYDLEDDLYTKINKYVKTMCHAEGFTCSFELMKKINELDKYKYPICIAKTQYSLVDNKEIKEIPNNYYMKLTDIKVKNGSKLIVCYFGNILTMPGLTEYPNVLDIKYEDGNVILPK